VAAPGGWPLLRGRYQPRWEWQAKTSPTYVGARGGLIPTLLVGMTKERHGALKLVYDTSGSYASYEVSSGTRPVEPAPNDP
jgi:hypothetical protein